MASTTPLPPPPPVASIRWGSVREQTICHHCTRRATIHIILLHLSHSANNIQTPNRTTTNQPNEQLSKRPYIHTKACDRIDCNIKLTIFIHSLSIQLNQNIVQLKAHTSSISYFKQSISTFLYKKTNQNHSYKKNFF